MRTVMSNIISYLFSKIEWPTGSRALAVVSDYNLSVFPAMSLMNMQLRPLAEPGCALMVVLLLQVMMTMTVILIVVFRVIRRSCLVAAFGPHAYGASIRNRLCPGGYIGMTDAQDG